MRGFTLLELSIVIAITLALMLVATPIYSILMVKTQLKETAAQVVMTLRDARESALSGFQGSAYGVFFSLPIDGPHSYIVYAGESYASRNPAYDRVNVLDGAVRFVNVGFVAGSSGIDINFSKGLGMPKNTGSLNIVHSVQGMMNISVNNFGKIEER